MRANFGRAIAGRVHACAYEPLLCGQNIFDLKANMVNAPGGMTRQKPGDWRNQLNFCIWELDEYHPHAMLFECLRAGYLSSKHIAIESACRFKIRGRDSDG